MILIERNMQQLTEVKEQLQGLLPQERSPIIVCAALERFDQEYINDEMGKYSREPVKIFVNCKAVRVEQKAHRSGDVSPVMGSRSPLNHNSPMRIEESRDSMRDPRMIDDIHLSKYEVASRTEMQYTVRENIEGYVTLVNIFLPSMCTTSKNPCLINVEDVETNLIDPTESLFYSSTVAFNERFTELLSKKHSSLNTLNVRMDFKACKDQAFSKRLLEKLC